MTDDVYREWDSAYVLGALTPVERREYETHLASCPGCRAAVAELAGLPGVLNRLPAQDALAIRDQDAGPRRDGDRVRVLADRARRRRRQGRLRTAAAGLGVAAVLAGGGVVVGTQLGDDPAGPAVATASARTVDLQPVGGSGLTAQLTATPTRWGTRLDWSCRYPAAVPDGYGVRYALVVITDDGQERTVATWSGDGTSASGLSATTDVERAAIRSIDVRSVGSTAPLARSDL
ncbi:zf-HC2 domain-containing protein [Modestobacter sp. NPDC049651]|uniref:anti-sigma factor family protein n=1 Tax=unclassified Modestobacter TaxID=2643866 RepID=UPI0033E03085